jgi:hypothetical protein
MQMRAFCLKCDEAVSIEDSFRTKDIPITSKTKTKSTIKTKPANSRIIETRMNDGTTKLIFTKKESFNIVYLIWYSTYGIIFSAWIIPILKSGRTLDILVNFLVEIKNLISMGLEGFLTLIVTVFFYFIFSAPLILPPAISSIKASLFIDGQSIKLTRELLGAKFIYEIRNQQSVRVVKKSRYRDGNENPVYGVGISNDRNQKLTVGLYVTDDEIEWIDYLIESTRQSLCRDF